MVLVISPPLQPVFEEHCYENKEIVMDPQWLRWAKKLQTMAQTGLTYAKDPYDRARYESICEIACEMMAMAAQADISHVREVLEESGYEVQARRLLAVYDREKHAHPPPPLSLTRVVPAQIERFFELHSQQLSPTDFD
jgi:hypothetical protein